MNRKNGFKGSEALQKTFQRAHKRQATVYFESLPIQTEDEKFLNGIVGYIKQNISNPDLSVERLSSNMNISRAWLYKKVLLLTGKSPVEFIRAIRLQRAIRLLENTQMKISQIASEVGLETPHYFSRIFKKEYNMLPSAYMHFVRKVKAQQVLNSYGLAFMIEKEGINNRSITNELPGFAAGEGTEGIQKITLAPGSSSTVLLNINVNSVAYFDDERSKWVTAPGEYKIMAVSSSKDIRQVATFKVD